MELGSAASDVTKALNDLLNHVKVQILLPLPFSVIPYLYSVYMYTEKMAGNYETVGVFIIDWDYKEQF